jgi:hypothetical protein
MQSGANRGRMGAMRVAANKARRGAVVVAVLLAGCGGGNTPPPAPAPTPDAAPEPIAAADADTFIPCTGDPRAEKYAPGMLKTGAKGVNVTLLSSDPGPPIKGNNTWKVLVTDPGKAPQAGAMLKVVPFMPDHGHGTIVKPSVTSLPDAGQYEIAPLNLFMAGLWEVTFTVTGATGVQDAVVFRFCIEQ